ncbi:hypothetical protein BOW53_03070 [Solemya pervernicosa gill symbiont]|uniref:Fibronectin type-III domain-containing protein n=2 Tax=Solemya pervernicosa gill symbiont TaxID=642797 RepID=A0A1T2L992_9GAMM|nr:hypothetical protein BOW53_03070 [Solemya pervernicosa gill symbiont]
MGWGDVKDWWDEQWDDFTDWVDDVWDDITDWFSPDLSDLEKKFDGTLLNKSSNVAEIPVVYGTQRVGGIITLMAVTGDKNEFLHLILTLCEGPISSINTVYLDDVPSTDERFAGSVWINKHKGEEDQLADADAVAEIPGWTSDHRQQGTAYLYVRLHWNRDVFARRPVITADIGGRLVKNYNHDIVTWSNNPAWCIADYLTHPRYGKRLPESAIDTASLIAAANYCEADISLYSGAPADQPRYTCDGVVDTSRTLWANIKELLSSCNGRLPRINGNYALIIDKDEVDAFAWDESMVLGSISMSGGSRRSRSNRISVGYRNPDNEWRSDTLPVDSAAYLAADNGIAHESRITLPFCISPYRAQMHGELAMRISRDRATVSFITKLAALDHLPSSVGTFSHSSLGWVDQRVRIVRMSLRLDATVAITLKRHDGDLYDLTLPGVYTPPTTTTLPNPLHVEPPTNLVLTEQQHDLYGEALFTWTEAADAFVTDYQAQIRLVAGGSWIDLGTREGTSRTVRNLLPGVYEFQVRSVNDSGVHSGWLTLECTIAIAAVVPRVRGLELFGQGNDHIFTGRDAKFAWREGSLNFSYDLGDEPFGAGSGARDLYFKDYEVRVLDIDKNLLRTEHVTDNWYIYSYEKNVEDDGPRREFILEVYQRGRQNQLSTKAARLRVENAAPAAPTAYKITPDHDSIIVDFDRPSDTDYKGCSVWIGTATGFTRNASTIIYTGANDQFLIDHIGDNSPLQPETEYFIAIRFEDEFGNSGTESVEISATTRKAPVAVIDGTLIGGVVWNGDDEEKIEATVTTDTGDTIVGQFNFGGYCDRHTSAGGVSTDYITGAHARAFAWFEIYREDVGSPTSDTLVAASGDTNNPNYFSGIYTTYYRTEYVPLGFIDQPPAGNYRYYVKYYFRAADARDLLKEKARSFTLTRHRA